MTAETIPVTAIKQGEIIPSKSSSPVRLVTYREDIRTVTVYHDSGYTWHADYDTFVIKEI